jgi:hypothetical protein
VLLALVALCAACSASDGPPGVADGGTGGGAPGSGGGSHAAGGSSGSGAGAGTGGTGGGSTASGGATGNGGSLGGGSNAGGAAGSGGDAAGSGGSSSGGSSGSGSSGSGGAPNGACDPGTTAPSWATQCPTAPATICVAGTWRDPGSTTNDPLVCESAHFAVHAPSGAITQQQCSSATNTLETVVWPTFFGGPMFFPEPYCNSATKYKASIVIHSDYGLSGGGWGNGYMGMWVGPGATADHWGLAHEFTHALQAQTRGLKCPSGPNTCGWIHESHANWQAHQLPEYHDTNVHCSEMLVNAPHLYLGSTRDRYCNWQFMEYLKDRYCYSAVSDIWTSSTVSDDPFTNIAATRGWSHSQLNDFFGEWAMHNVTWDYRDPPPAAQNSRGAFYRSKYGGVTDTSKAERRLRLTRLDPLEGGSRRYVVPTEQAPQRWGYNVVRLHPDVAATAVTVTFRGVVQSEADSDFRWGLVATDAGITQPRYSALQRGTDGTLTFCVTAGESLFLVVVGTPSERQQIVWDQLYPTVYRYPYMVQLEGAQADGFQPGSPNPSANGARWSNGGGWVATGANVAQGAYVGPYAAVLGGTVGAAARIEGHAVITGGNVTSGTVSGISVLQSGYTVSGAARVALGWPYGPGWFERPQTISGSAVMIGDLELRGANQNKASGTYCGIVEGSAAGTCDGADVTAKPPFQWRD